MLPRSTVCLRCQFEVFSAKWASRQPSLQPWVLSPRRTMAMARRQRRSPSRMILTDDVSQSPDRTQQSARRKMEQPGPFGGMNRKEANFTGKHTQRSAAELKRLRGDKETSKDVKKDDKPTFHALKMQAMLTPISYNQRSKIKEKLEKVESFEEFDLLPDLGQAIYSQAFPGLIDVVPTPAQKLLIPAMLDSAQKLKKRSKDGEPVFDQFLLAAETGSGKTLAYALPVIDAIKRAEVTEEAEEVEKKAERERNRGKNELFPDDADEDPPHRTSGRPKAIILVPSAELVTQIGGLVKQLAHKVKYRSAAISAKQTPKYIANNLFNRNGIDIVVTTPHLISSIARKEPNLFSRVTHLVIDEADSLLDRSFSSTTLEIIDKVSPSLKQLVLCSATIPKSLNNLLDKRFPNILRLVTPKLHSIPRRVQLGVIDVDRGGLYRNNKSIACADIIWSIGKNVHEDKETHHSLKSMIVFVNEREKAEEVASFLASKGIDVVALTRDTSEQRQSELLSKFTAPTRQDGDSKQASEPYTPFIDTNPDQQAPSKKLLPNVRVLVTTDIASRGIDTLAVRHVILYDVPHTTIDFIHRLGRVGRMGRRGRGIVLVGKGDRKDIVREVQDGMFKGQALI